MTLHPSTTPPPRCPTPDYYSTSASSSPQDAVCAEGRSNQLTLRQASNGVGPQRLLAELPRIAAMQKVQDWLAAYVPQRTSYGQISQYMDAHGEDLELAAKAAINGTGKVSELHQANDQFWKEQQARVASAT